MMLPLGQEGTTPSLAAPRLPEPAAPSPFPVLATVAPVLGSLVLWAVTTSPFALVFALLGPIIAVASVGDTRLSARRHRKAEDARFLRDCERTAEAIAEAHTHEIQALDSAAPNPHRTLAQNSPHPQRWRADISAALPITLGNGTVRSGVIVRGDPLAAASASERTRLDALETQARVIHLAPVVIDARMGVGIVGPPVLTNAAVRAVAVQVATRVSPAATTLTASVSEREGDWVARLPHPGRVDASTDAPAVLAFTANGDREAEVIVAAATRAEVLPLAPRVILRVGRESTVVSHPDPAHVGELRPVFVSHREMVVWARGQRLRAEAAGLIAEETRLPVRITLGELMVGGDGGDGGDDGVPVPVPVPVPDARGLAAVIGVTSAGPARIDLTLDGPHAVVGGTTGSGKSELLLSWVVAMATAYPPSEVTFLFVDFKGGAAFEPVRALPHSVGVITDLDTHEVLRALTSLRAEMRRRERVLAAAGLRSLADAAGDLPLPRLVLVIDEYAALLEEHPHLQPLIADLCARGRSLGVHLILCTQRPSGVVRDGILANCALRISLRVHDRSDSIAVLGSPVAAELPPEPVGRAIVAVLGGSTRTVQVATTTPADVAAAANRWADSAPPRVPWCPPLPARLDAATLNVATLDAESLSALDAAGGSRAHVVPSSFDDVPGPASESGGIVFGLVDLPQQQRWGPAVLEPARGSVLVLGASGAGKTGVLRAIAARAAGSRGVTVVAVPPTLPAIWDAVHDALAHPTTTGSVTAGSGNTRRILLLDDIDAVLASCPDDYSAALSELLYRLVREGSRRGVSCVLAAQRLTGALHGLAALCESTVLLRLPSLHEHVVAGGRSDDWDAQLPPGGGYWRGDRIQVVATAGSPPLVRDDDTVHHDTVQVDATEQRVLAVVSTRPRQLAATLRRGGRPVMAVGGQAIASPPLDVHTGAGTAVLIGDPDGWMARWGALTELREHGEILFDGCSTSEFRTLTGIRELPPPVEAGNRALWLLRPDGTVCRAALVTAEHH